MIKVSGIDIGRCFILRKLGQTSVTCTQPQPNARIVLYLAIMLCEVQPARKAASQVYEHAPRKILKLTCSEIDFHYNLFAQFHFSSLLNKNNRLTLHACIILCSLLLLRPFSACLMSINTQVAFTWLHLS